MPTNPTDTEITDRPSALGSEAIELVDATVENDGAPDECVIFPAGASEDELMTNWISAQGDSFVALKSMR